MTSTNDVRQVRSRLLRDAVVTVAAVGVAVAALDDITTDNALRFPVERTALAVCAAWFGFVAWRLVHGRHRVVGGLSFSLLVLAALVQPAVGRGMSPTQLEYLATVGTLAWFLGIAGILAFWAWRPANRYAA
jgi:hypothetical protein